MLYLILLVSFFCFFSYSIEYIYPVDYLATEKKIIYLHQKSNKNTELLLLSINDSKNNIQLTSSYCNPAGLQIKPNQLEYSFIDNDIIKIKEFNTARLKLIMLKNPLHKINTMSWINNNYFYVSAKEQNTYNIYQVDCNGIVKKIVTNKSGDCLFPQKINNTLFYIERIHSPLKYKKNISTTERNYYSIVSVPYKENLQQNDTDNIINKDILYDNGKEPIAFLEMISEQEGFFIEHDLLIDTEESIIIFSYNHLKKTKKKWVSTMLFNFSIPSFFLIKDNDNCLYESLFPLLPTYTKKAIFFVSTSKKTDNLNVFRYDLTNNSIKQKTFATNEAHYFAPLIVNDKLYYGGTEIAKNLKNNWLYIH